MAVTVVLSAHAPDFAYSKMAAEKFCKRHSISIVSDKSIPLLVDSVIKTLKTFDPIEIRNSLVVLEGIRAAKLEGCDKLMTGDGADELFAGYNFLTRYHSDLPRLQKELERLWSVMHFSSLALGHAEGVRISTPYLDSEFVEFSKSLDVSEKVGTHDGVSMGKFLLRRCFEEVIGPELAWRRKMAQEEGSGMSEIKTILESGISDDDFARGAKAAAAQKVKLRSKEHMFYYQSYLKYFDPPDSYSSEMDHSAGRCPECRALFRTAGKFCRTCGAFPVDPR